MAVPKVDFRTKYGRDAYRSVAEAFARAAYAVDAERNVKTLARLFIGAKPLQGSGLLSVDGNTEVPSVQTLSTLDMIRRDVGESAERREEAEDIINAWDKAARDVRAADAEALNAERGGKRLTGGGRSYATSQIGMTSLASLYGRMRLNTVQGCSEDRERYLFHGVKEAEFLVTALQLSTGLTREEVQLHAAKLAGVELNEVIETEKYLTWRQSKR